MPTYPPEIAREMKCRNELLGDCATSETVMRSVNNGGKSFDSLELVLNITRLYNIK